jgi:hypothetical protein
VKLILWRSLGAKKLRILDKLNHLLLPHGKFLLPLKTLSTLLIKSTFLSKSLVTVNFSSKSFNMTYFNCIKRMSSDGASYVRQSCRCSATKVKAIVIATNLAVLMSQDLKASVDVNHVKTGWSSVACDTNALHFLLVSYFVMVFVS